jgi:hypothetical protein
VANLPSEVGYLTVVDNVVDVFSDSADAGDVPDISQATALVTFVPVGIPAARPYLIVPATGQREHIYPIKAFLANGQLYRTADGKAPATGETPTTPGVPLLAPQQGSIDLAAWWWEAQYAPAVGEQWTGYSVRITGKPGDTVSVADAAMTQDLLGNLSTVKQALAWYVTPANTANPPLVSDVPAGARVGDTLIDISKTPWFAYQIGA